MELCRTTQDLTSCERLKRKRDEELKRSLPRQTEFSSILDRHRLMASVEEKQLDAAQKRYDQLKEKYDRAMDTFVKSLLEALPLQDIKEKLLKDAHNATGDHAQEQRLGTLEGQVRGISDTIATARLGDMAALKEEHERLKAETVANKAVIAQLLRDIEGLNGQMQETQQLRSENAANKADIAQLLDRVDKLTDQVARQGEQLQQTRGVVDAQAPKIVALDNKVQDHAETLANFDADNLNQAADFFAFEKPRLLEDLDSAKQNITNLSVALNSMLTKQTTSPPPAPSHQGQEQQQQQARTAATDPQMLRILQESHGKLAKTFGGMVDELRNADESLRERIQKLEERPAAAARVGPESEQLMRDVKMLSSTLQTSINGVKDEFDHKYSTIQTMVTTLDSQFNNVTTKEVCEAIMGHLEHLAPNSEQLRQLQQDVQTLNSQVNAVFTHLHDINHQGSQLQLLATLDGRKRTNEMAAGYNGASPPPQGLPQSKRRRVLEGPLGQVLPLENGHIS